MMRRYATLLLFLAMLTTKFGIVTITARLDPDMLRIVDESKTSALVRGNAPLDDTGTFDAGLLLQNVNNRFHKSFRKLVVVSLLNVRSKDEAVVLGEIQRKTKASSVEFIHCPVAGSWFSLLSPWIPIVPLDTATGGAWKVTSRLHDLLLTHGTADTVIYFHCMRGKDRTGLVAGIYGMRYQDKSLGEVQTTNWQVANRKLQFLEDQSLVAGSNRKQWESSGNLLNSEL